MPGVLIASLPNTSLMVLLLDSLNFCLLVPFSEVMTLAAESRVLSFFIFSENFVHHINSSLKSNVALLSAS